MGVQRAAELVRYGAEDGVLGLALAKQPLRREKDLAANPFRPTLQLGNFFLGNEAATGLTHGPQGGVMGLSVGVGVTADQRAYLILREGLRADNRPLRGVPG